MRSTFSVACLLLAIFAWSASGALPAESGHGRETTTNPLGTEAATENRRDEAESGISSWSAKGVIVADSGLSSVEAAEFFHLSEGSEVFPLVFLLALKNSVTGKPFLKDVERFGLIPQKVSKKNPFGLPIGVTADVTVDLQRTKMVGINCAACHVGLFSHRDDQFLVVGAPNQFNLKSYFSELATSAKATYSDIDSMLEFVGRLYSVYGTAVTAGEGDDAPPIAAPRMSLEDFGPRAIIDAPFARQEADSRNIASLFSSIEAMKEAGELGHKTAELLIKTHASEMERDPDVLGDQLLQTDAQKLYSEWVTGIKTNNPQMLLNAGNKLAELDGGFDFALLQEQDLAWVADATIPAEGPLSELESANDREVSVIATVQNWVKSIRVLKARASFLLGLLESQAPAGGTDPGPGRVDAFGGARNLIFHNAQISPTAPVCWPHIWGISDVTWYHWDGSTNSLLERNVGQALGLGAVFNRTSFHSTIRVKNIQRLETIARRIEPPQWPADQFGDIKSDMAKRGEAIFNKRCAECHHALNRIADLESATVDQAAMQDPLFDLGMLGTDRNRALNFAQPVGETQFNDAIAAALHKIIIKADGAINLKDRWRVTKKYSCRPLTGIWATPPFLHNGSVPTLYHLLLPANRRPKTFPVGHRHYDIKKLGLTTDVAAPRFVLDTDLSGNANTGHSGPEFGTDLNDDQRYDLLEYLKSLGAGEPR